nr:secondary thiamine-phosphate synthase enzyme YjbQ [Saprospiraceae bacterium]
MKEFKIIQLPPYPRGFHLITPILLDSLPPLPDSGLMYFFIQHTSAALTINENADPSVRRDLEKYIDNIVPEDFPGLEHTLEGPDDMPAHVKASFFGSSVSIPIIGGRPALGTWQGIFLCEFRNRAPGRKVVCGLL